MTPFTLSFIALYGVLLVIAGCLAAIHVRGTGYITRDQSNPRWIRALYKSTRPHAGTRILVNLSLWIVLFAILCYASYRHLRFGALAVDGSAPLSAKKFLEYADGELWVLQCCAALFVLCFTVISMALSRITKLKPGWLQRTRAYILDDLWGIVLNFGSMFLVAAFVQAYFVNIHYLWMLLFSAVNIVTYALFSEVNNKKAIPT